MNINTPKKTIYISVEIKVREFVSQILFSYYAVIKGYRVYLGSKNEMLNLIKNKTNKGGIFFYKAGVPKNFISIIDKKTDIHAVFDQELMPGISSDREYASLVDVFHPEGKNKIDAYFTVSKRLFNIAKNNLKLTRGEIYNTGSPRIDLWKNKYRKIFSEKVSFIKKKYGKFILFNSDLQYITKNYADEATEYLPWGGSNKNKDNIKKIRIKRAKKNFEEFGYIVNFFKDLSIKSPDIKIVIRPHPAENIYSWKLALGGNKNIFIEDPIDDVFPWILASDFVLHRGCTTSLQSLFIRKPTIFLNISKKFNSSYNFKKMSFDLSIKVKNADEFIALKNKIKNKKRINPPKYFYHHLGIKKNGASNEMLRIFDQLKCSKELQIKKNQRNILLIQILKYSIFLPIKRIILLFLIKLNLIKKNLNSYDRFEKIYNGITSSEVNYYLSKINKLSKVFSYQISKDIVCIDYK